MTQKSPLELNIIKFKGVVGISLGRPHKDHSANILTKATLSVTLDGCAVVSSTQVFQRESDAIALGNHSTTTISNPG